MIWHAGAERITAAEREHLERVRELGCVCCAQFGVIWYQPVEAHHLLLGGKRISHMHTICLCPAHHRRVPFTLYQVLMLPAEARVSLADGSRAFARAFGSERELYQRVCLKLGLEARWPETKVLPRRMAGS